MTGLRVAFLALLVSAALPVAAASTEMSKDEDAQVDALSLEVGLTAGAETDQVDVDKEMAWADTRIMAGYVPSDSGLFSLLDFFLLTLDSQSTPSDAPSVDAPTVEAPTPDTPGVDAESE